MCAACSELPSYISTMVATLYTEYSVPTLEFWSNKKKYKEPTVWYLLGLRIVETFKDKVIAIGQKSPKIKTKLFNVL